MQDDNTSLPTEDPNPSGLCMCGCGERTKTHTWNDAVRGYRNGHHSRYVRGHHGTGHKIDRRSGVYALRNTVTGCCYIGSSKDIHTRWLTHRSELNRKEHANLNLQRDWDHYGEGAFTVDILQTTTLDELAAAENEWLEQFNGDVYNTRSKANQRRPISLTPEDITPAIIDDEAFYSTGEAAVVIGLSASRVRQVARDLDLGRKIGRDRILSSADVEVIRRRPRQWSKQ